VKTLGQEDFLKLISVQMQAQDPAQPDEGHGIHRADGELHLARADEDAHEILRHLLDPAARDGCPELPRQTVTLLDSDKGIVSGTVSSVSFQNGEPRIVVNDTPYDPAFVQSIQISAK